MWQRNRFEGRMGVSRPKPVIKSSQVANFQIHTRKMHHAKSSEQTKQKKSRMSFGTLSLSCGYKIPWTPPAYGADWANFPWTHLSLRGIPTRECFRYLFFIITSRCDTTDHNGTESSDAPHDARRISMGTSTNKGRCPTMLKPIRGRIIIEERGCL